MQMARRLSTYVLVCSYLATALFMLAEPGGGLAMSMQAPRARSEHPRHHRHGLGNRRHPRKVEQSSARGASKKVPAKSQQPSKGRQPSSTSSTPALSGLAPNVLASTGSNSVDATTDESPTVAPPQAPAAVAPISEARSPAGEEPPLKEPPAKESPTAKEPPAKESPTAKEPPAKEEPKVSEPPIESDPPSSRKLIWADEFNGPAGTSPDSAKWSFDTGGGGWGNEELESYTSKPANAELNGQGDLAITARAEKYTGADGITRNYTSARLQTLNTFQFQYGLVEARIQVPAGQGLVAQFWALGHEAYESADAWPACGEIDTMEVLGSEPNVVNGTLHAPWSWAPTGVQGTAESATPLSAGFHVYSVEWEPERISFMLDGSVYKTITPADLPAGAAWPFKHPYFLLLDLAVGGEWPGSPNASTHFPAQMLVDWVRVWQ
jgi:beta-glucanase (GH16 family)